MMSKEKYQMALNDFFEILIESKVKLEKNIIGVIKELVNEKLEFESRKDKLIVGSKWECVAVCLVSEISNKEKSIPILTVLGSVCLFVGNDDLMSTIKVKDKRYVIPTSQFLLCFKPIKEGEIT